MTTLSKFNPNYQRNVNIFDDIFENFFKINEFDLSTTSYPYDVVENDTEIFLEYMLPGFKKEDISIEIEGDELKIKGRRVANEKGKYQRKASFFGEFTKQFKLPEIANKDEIDATMEDGILKVIIPKNKNDAVNKAIKIR